MNQYSGKQPEPPINQYTQQPGPSMNAYGQHPVVPISPYGQQPGAPIVQQPYMPSGQVIPGVIWMPMPTLSITDCPPGLAYLTLVDRLIVKQKVELLEAFTGFETNNKYEIINAHGQTIFFAAENSDCCTRWLCGPNRPFDMTVLGFGATEVIHVNRPLACDSCLCPCSRQSIEICSPPGTVIGSIKKDWSILTPKFSVKDASGRTVLKIQGPLCTCIMCGHVDFEVLSADGNTQVGQISKQWSGLGREYFTDADTFGISFPMDLDVKIKAVLVGAVLLIDFLYFERKE